MATIREVAKLAQVAPITVSRVINNSGYVSAETRARVEKAIAELGYVPNMLGPSLRLKRTNTIALVLTDVTNPFFTTVARGVEDVASEGGYSVFLCNSDESLEKQTQYINSLLSRQVDGILLVPASNSVDNIDTIRQQDVTLVVMDRKVNNQVDSIRCDSESGAYQIVKHLVALGHRHVAVLAGPESISVSQERISGAQRALAEAGLPPAYVFHGMLTQQSGAAMTEQALAQEPRPTAIFAINNFITIGAMKALLAAGIRVPQDISVAGFDDLPPGLTIDPFFTVISQPAYEMGRRAAELLVQRLKGEAAEDEDYLDLLLPTQLVVRRSTAAPPAG